MSKREETVQKEIRLAASEDGILLLRQNTGALPDRSGRIVRFGLANESAAMNKTYKSGDLIGITPLIIGPQHVGQLVGVFTSVEVKHEGWQWAGNAHETAQSNWANWVRQYGGLSGFAPSVQEARTIWRK